MMICAPSLLSGSPSSSSCRKPADLHVLNGLTGLDERFEVRPLAPLAQVANPHAEFPANGVKRRDGDASVPSRASTSTSGWMV